GAVGAGGVQDGQSVRRVFRGEVAARPGRPAGPAVPPPVEGDDPVVAGQVGHLHLPGQRMDHGPRRQEQDGRPALAEDLVEHLDARALDVAITVRLACSHRFPPDQDPVSTLPPAAAAPGDGRPGTSVPVLTARVPLRSGPVTDQIRASYTRLNGVPLTRRKRLRPALVTTPR